MIGYHFTTWEAYQKIQHNGLRLSHLSESSYPVNKCVIELLDDGCIWVYTDLMSNYKLMGMIMYVAIKQNTDRVVLLEVEYPESSSAKCLGALQTDDIETLIFTHTYDGAGPYKHVSEPFDLIVQPVPPQKLDLLGDWNLVDFADKGILEFIDDPQ